MISLRFVRCAVAALAVLAAACDPHILVGADLSDGSCPIDAGGGDALAPVAAWSTGFENGFNDWGQPPNCYVSGGATYAIVTAPSPVRTGLHAAAFTVNSDLTTPPQASEARCIKAGVLPQSAYYGAWYYVPAVATNKDNWNLLHFRGATFASGPTHGLWDVSLTNDADGGLATSVYDFLKPLRSAAGAIPIKRWFHLEVFWRRACDSTARFTLYIDSQPVLDLPGLAIDDSVWGEWHVGNLATALSPGLSTVYVDDVTISASGP